MEGRLEHDLQIQEANQKKLEAMPEFVSEYYKFMKANGMTAQTCRNYLSKIHKFLSFIDLDVAKIKAADINTEVVWEYFSKIETISDNKGNVKYASGSYKKGIWTCLNGFMIFLVSMGYIDQNYLSNIKKPKSTDQERVNEKRVLLTEDDFNAILYSVNKNTNEMICKRDKAMLALMMCTGIRESAISEINIENVDLEAHKIIGIAKGKQSMEYKFNENTAIAIKEWLAVRDGYVKKVNASSLFLSNQGNRMAVTSIAKMVKKYTKAGIGKALSPHKLRAGYVSILYNRTGNLEFVRRAVGHASVSTTKLYAVTEGNERAEAADMINFNI